jgi:hypothetical protein
MEHSARCMQTDSRFLDRKVENFWYLGDARRKMALDEPMMPAKNRVISGQKVSKATAGNFVDAETVTPFACSFNKHRLQDFLSGQSKYKAAVFQRFLNFAQLRYAPRPEQREVLLQRITRVG